MTTAEKNVPVSSIAVKKQSRRAFPEAGLKELADSIKALGVINALTVRRSNGGYELVAGERRLRAAKLAGLREVPAVVTELDDQQALAVQAAENLHREDLTPVEEARGFRALLEAGRYDPRGLAAAVCKPLGSVVKSLRLLELPKAFLDLVDDGTYQAEHGHQLLRAPSGRWPELAKLLALRTKQAGRVVTPVEFAALVDQAVSRDLSRAPWDKSKPYAGKPACAGCAFNSESQRDLFGAASGRCMDAACFAVKKEASEAEQSAALREQYPGVEVLPSTEEYAVEQKHKVTDLPPSVLKAVRGAVKANPKAFAVAMVRDSEWKNGKREEFLRPAVFVRQSGRAEVLKAIGPRHPDAYRFGGYQSGSPQQRKPGLTPKERHLRRAAWKAWFREAAKVDVAKSRRALEAILSRLEPGHYETKIPQEVVVGLSAKPGKYHGQVLDYSKLGVGQLLSLALLFALDTHEPDAKAFRALGVDTERAKRGAQALAAKEWEARKK